jgi:hypothetical protein
MNRLTLSTRCEALFASSLQSSQRPSAQAVHAAVSQTLRTLGIEDCADRVAPEFGDHPETAVIRMRWARETVLRADIQR